ncbi:hypothetical protein, partial [Enterobacter hormaechei]
MILPTVPKGAAGAARFRLAEFCAGLFSDFQKYCFLIRFHLADEGQIASMQYFVVMIDYGRRGR